MSYWIAGATVVAGVGGALVGAEGTKDAQNAANQASAQQAAAQSSQSFQNYLQSRGVNIQQLLQKYPEFQTEYNRARAAGEKRDFNTWIKAALEANPGHPIWNDINNPTVGAGAANTTLPAWAVDANGQPLQPSLLNQLVAIQSGTNLAANAPVGQIATTQNIHNLFEARPELLAEINAAREGSDDPRTPEQWLSDHITQSESQSGGGTFTTALRDFLTGEEKTSGKAPPSVDPAITALVPGATQTAAGIFDGTLLNQALAGLKPVQDARLAEADAVAKRIDELRTLSGGIRTAEQAGLDDLTKARQTGATEIRDASRQAAEGVHAANIDKLAALLGVRRDAAQQIYEASMASAGGVRDAREKGARDIYGAELLSADTYAQSAEQALNRLLAQQTANRARQGFSGGSSGSDLTRARLTAGAVQQGAGARAQAGVNLQDRLARTGEGYAIDTGTAGVGRATTLGRAGEADALAQLQAAVDLARSLGLADTTFAGTNALTRESDASGRMNSNVADATRLFGLPLSDADIAAARANTTNAQDALSQLIASQNRAVSSIGLPYNLAAADLAMKGNVEDLKYTNLDALLKRLGSFGVNQASGPTLTTAPVGSVLNGQQVAGAGLTALGTSLGGLASNQQLMEAIQRWGSGGGTTTTPTGTRNAVPAGSYDIPADTTGQFRYSGGNYSVFGPPG